LGFRRKLDLHHLEFEVSFLHAKIELPFDASSFSDYYVCSEASESHLKSINRLNIITFLTSFMTSADKCPIKVVVAAGKLSKRNEITFSK
jgi:hypothetical protein